MRERHDSYQLQEILWRETDLHYCVVGEVSPPFVGSAIVQRPDEMEQRWGGQRLVRRAQAVVETAGLADRLCWLEVLRLAACQPASSFSR